MIICLIYFVGYPEETYPVYEHDEEYRGDDEEYSKPRITPFTMVEPAQQPSAEALAERMEQVEEQAMARKLSIVREVDEEEEEDDKEEEGEETEEEGEETEEDMEEEEAEAEKRHLLSVSSTQLEREERLGLEVSNELQAFSGRRKQISFSEHRHVFHYPKEDTYKEDQDRDGDEEDEGDEEEQADEDDPVIEAESLQFSADGCLNAEEEAEQDGHESLLTSEDGAGGSDVLTEAPRGVQASGLRMRNRRET